MERVELKAAVECLLFVSPDILDAKKIAKITESDEPTIREIIEELNENMNRSSSGLQIVEAGGGYRMCSKKEYSQYIEKLMNTSTSSRLSKAALETLSIIAYRQPITRQEIERIRGVNCDRVVLTLLEKDLVEEAGKKDTIGHPMLYCTTKDFLVYFGLNSLEDLPSEEEFTVDIN